MIASFARAATIAALCLAIGLHWFLLQSVAWSAMLVQYSTRSSLSEAVAKTFDGAHPCSLCLAMQKGKSSEKKSDLQPLTPKFHLFIVAVSARVHPAAASFSYPVSRALFFTRGESPPVPPPRFALV